MNTPIRKTVTVPLSPSEAFALFFEEIDLWWPDERRSDNRRAGKRRAGTQGPRPTMKVEPHKGGRIIAVNPDGTRSIWGRIIGWNRDSSASFTWFPDEDAADATCVTVHFQAAGDGCRVIVSHGLAHKNFDLLGPQADAVSTSFLQGWDMVLGSFCSAAARQLCVA